MAAPPLFAILAFAPFGEALVILWAAILIYGAHTFLTVVQETAAGCDAIVWPGDPWPERLGSFFYLATLTAAWLGPVCALTWAGYLELAALDLVLITAAYLWLLFPLSLLSSLSAPTAWMILRPAVVGRLLGRLPSLLGFYLSSALVLVGSLGVFGLAIFVSKLEPPEVPGTDMLSQLFKLTLAAGGVLLLPLAAVLAAAGLLVYGRLVGRLGLLLNLATPARDEPPAEAKPQPSEGEVRAPAAGEETPTQVYAPTADASTGEDAYPLQAEGMLAPALAAVAVSPPDYFTALPPDAPGVEKAALAVRHVQPSRLELRLGRRATVPESLRWPLWQGVYGFPFRRSNLRPLLTLTVGNLLVGMVLYLVVRVLPF